MENIYVLYIYAYMWKQTKSIEIKRSLTLLRIKQKAHTEEGHHTVTTFPTNNAIISFAFVNLLLVA